MDADVVQYEVRDRVCTLWLNRPQKKNCVNLSLLEELERLVQRAEADDQVSAVVVRGRGNTFCSGGDLEQLVGPALSTAARSLDLAAMSSRTYGRFYSLSKPTIAAVEGYAVAGGFELMISCDFALATSSAKIGDYHMNRGLFGGAGPIYRLPRYVGIRKAKELLLSGKLLSGLEAAQWGLVNAVAEPEAFEQLIAGFVAPLADKSPLCMQVTKMAINRGLDADSESLLTMEKLACSVVQQSADAKEGVQAFLEKRKPKWTGS